MAILYPAREKFLQGSSIFGSKDGALGPANAYWRTEPQANLTGTISVTGTTVSGTGTAFTTELEVGDWVALGTGNVIRQVASIADNDDMTLTESATISSGSTIKKVVAIPLGRTGKISIQDGDKWAEIKFSQQGDSPANMVRVGNETMVEIEIAEAAASLLYSLNDSYNVQKTGVNIVSMARTLNIGTRHSDIWRQLTIVKLVGQGDSNENLEIVHFPLAAPDFETKIDFDASSQQLIPVKFNVYPDYTKLINGKPVIWYNEGFTGFDA
jgi:hypothetical protein